MLKLDSILKMPSSHKYSLSIAIIVLLSWLPFHSLGFFQNFRSLSSFYSNSIDSIADVDITLDLLLSSDEDPYHVDLSYMIRRVKEGDGEWMHTLLGMSRLSDSQDTESSSTMKSSKFDIPEAEKSSIPLEISDEIVYDKNTQSKSPPSTDSLGSRISDLEGADEVLSDSPSPPSSNSKKPQEFAQLQALGYSDEDITSLKPKVCHLIVQNKVPRPNSALPKMWLRSDSAISSDRTDTLDRSQSRDSSSVRRPSSSGDGSASKPRQQQQQQNRQPKQQQRRRPRVPLESMESGAEVRWSGSPPTEDEAEHIEYVSSETDEGEAADDIPLWPTRDEFKDMLIEESKFRLGAVGNWMAPFVREENKWRFRLYDGWLKFLDDGLSVSDEFDEVAEDFKGQIWDRDDSRSVGVDSRGTRSRTPSSRRGLSGAEEEREREKAKEYEDYLRRVEGGAKDFYRAQGQFEEDELESDMLLPDDKEAWFSEEIASSALLGEKDTERDAATESDDDELFVRFGDSARFGGYSREPKSATEKTRRREGGVSSGYMSPAAFEEAWMASAERRKIDDYPPTQKTPMKGQEESRSGSGARAMRAAENLNAKARTQTQTQTEQQSQYSLEDNDNL